MSKLRIVPISGYDVGSSHQLTLEKRYFGFLWLSVFGCNAYTKEEVLEKYRIKKSINRKPIWEGDL